MAQVTIPRWALYAGVIALVAATAFALGGVYTARGDHHDQTFYACLYAGSLSQVSTTPPANCGRGAEIQWTSAVEAPMPTFVTRRNSDDIPAGDWGNVFVSCEPGEIATGGGFESAHWSSEIPAANHFVVASLPSISGADTPDGWSITVVNPTVADHTVDVWVICMSFGP